MYNFEHFAELERYEAEQELNDWIDEQEENYIMMMGSQEISPEVVE